MGLSSSSERYRDSCEMLGLLAYFLIIFDVRLLPYQALQRVQSNEIEGKRHFLFQPEAAQPLRGILRNHLHFMASVLVRFRYLLLLREVQHAS